MSVSPIPSEALLALYLRETGTNIFPEFKVDCVEHNDEPEAWSPLEYTVTERSIHGYDTYKHRISILDMMSWTVTRSVPAHQITRIQDSIIIECDSAETRDSIAVLMNDVIGIHVADTKGESVGGYDNFGQGLVSKSQSPNHVKVTKED